MRNRRWAGPWVTVPGSIWPDDQNPARTNAYVSVLAPHSNDAIPVADCSCDPRFRSEAECEAIAALIAAAPDMYLALEALLDGNSDALDMARAAIAKADAPPPYTSAVLVEG